MCIRDRFILTVVNMAKTSKLRKKYEAFMMGKDATATTGYHYGYYAGQPLPIAQTTTFSDLTHYTTITVSYTHLDVYKRQGKI